MTTSASATAIRLRGVRHNNLKNFDLDLALGQLTVITGLSGSGKSSLAFDTLFAEGQRRYIETFSPYARQFFDRMDKPQVDRIEGIPPAIALEQRNSVRTTRSTVGTMTELCDYLKLLWPHVARLHCRQCHQPVRCEPPAVVWETLTRVAGSPGSQAGPEVLVTFALPLSAKLPLAESLALISRQGYQRVLIGTRIVRIDEALAALGGSAPSSLTVVQDRLRPVPAQRSRFIEACEQAYHFGKGKLTLIELHADGGLREARPFSSGFHCATCDLDYREPTPALFSFNHPIGACPACKGFGRIITIDYQRAIPDRSRTLAGGCVKPWQVGHGLESQADLLKFCRKRHVPVDVPFAELSREHQDWVIQGDPGYGTDERHQWPRFWYGVKGYFRWLESKSYKMHVRVLLSRYRAYATCPDCQGRRLQPDALLFRAELGTGAGPGHPAPSPGLPGPAAPSLPASISLADFYATPVDQALGLIDRLASQLSLAANEPLHLVLGEVRSRLSYLEQVGLGYVTLDRPTRTLSGGETERVNLTTCLGTRLVNTLFVLDEPSVGLHPRDTERLVQLLGRLRDAGNTVVLVEHEASVMRAADQIVDLGPGQGERGGEILFQGPLRELLKSEHSLTGQYLSGRREVAVPSRRQVQANGGRDASLPRCPAGAEELAGRTSQPLLLAEAVAPYRTLELAPPEPEWLRITGATLHNLKDLTVAIPLRRFVCLTGVSGSGKTTLAREILLPALHSRLGAAADGPESGAEDSAEQGEDAEESMHGAVIEGWESIQEVVLVDQSPLGKTPRSNPIVYVGAFDALRDLFAQTELARQRGLNSSAFSFNSGVGQCERCRGAGFEKIEMQFLSDIFIRCPDCQGRRYRSHILEVRLAGKLSGDVSVEWSIADLLEATVDDAFEFVGNFSSVPSARRASESLKLLQDVGLGYLRLGQPINTLSGGETQRLKLVRHLAQSGLISPVAAPGVRRAGRDGRGTTPSPSSASRHLLFLFDEPTTGLHFEDVRLLLEVFQRLADAGHSLVVIEHNLEVIKCADWVIDLGPEGGAGGGRLVAEGPPEVIAACAESHTGAFLRGVLGIRGGSAAVLAPSALARPVVRRSEAAASGGAIVVHGAREHNLKNLSIEIPRGQFVVITGVSGSGKSTLAFDLLFAEGQRRFLDCMSSYARQFVEQMARPEVDRITGLPPTVSIEQRTTRGGGKSTVATVTEIYHFLRLLFARLGTQFCPACQIPVEAQTGDQLEAGLVKELRGRGDLLLLAPVVRNRKGFHADVAEWAAQHGYREIRADGRVYDTSKPFRLDRFREHDVEIVVGVLDAGKGKARSRSRGAGGAVPSAGSRTPRQLIDEALRLGHGTVFALDNHGRITLHSTERACPGCSRSFAPLDPKNFSYNSSQGWCPKCRGFGELFYLPDVDRGANADAIEESWWRWQEGEREACPDCQGSRLRPESRAVRLTVAPPLPGKRGPKDPIRPGRDTGAKRAPAAPTIDDFSSLAVGGAHGYFRKLRLKGRSAAIARDILPELVERLKFLEEVGLGYLQLGRSVTTLSGGEAQRIRLAAQLGSNLSGVLYVLDEPTIGLHARDNEQLLQALAQLRSRGNSLVVVEHDEETMRRADHIIDLGPGAGVHGGTVVATGTLEQLKRNPASITGRELFEQETRSRPARGTRRPVVSGPTGVVGSRTGPAVPGETLRTGTNWLRLAEACANNLKKLTVEFPLHRLVVITGVSGSGKSTLIRECLFPAVAAVVQARSAAARTRAAKSSGITGCDSLKAVYEVDQSPIGRTPRSTPATYVGFFDEIRSLFAQTPEARMRGYTAGRFSFNSAQGRCPECEGAGIIKLEMNFLPPAFVRCETCGGSRYGRETLDIQYAGRNIAEVLDLSVEEAIGFFQNVPKILRPLQALKDTGLDYIKLGQTSPTLSGGEAQRVKLVTHLLTGLKDQYQIPDPADPRVKRNLFILEEPTIGLHASDVRRLVEVLQRLVDSGHSVLVIEHNLDLIAEADWVIDLGPEGGEAGGRVVVAGTPEQVAKNRSSHTGGFLRRILRTK